MWKTHRAGEKCQALYVDEKENQIKDNLWIVSDSSSCCNFAMVVHDWPLVMYRTKEDCRRLHGDEDQLGESDKKLYNTRLQMLDSNSDVI